MAQSRCAAARHRRRRGQRRRRVPGEPLEARPQRGQLRREAHPRSGRLRREARPGSGRLRREAWPASPGGALGAAGGGLARLIFFLFKYVYMIGIDL